MMTLPITAQVIETLRVNKDRMYDAMTSHLLATELAHYLVDKGLPFRQAHEVIGKLVQLALSIDQPLWSLPLQVYQSISPLFERDVHTFLDFEKSIERYKNGGGPARASVLSQIEQLRARYAEEADLS
jgi:argininosuccinate lyase